MSRNDRIALFLESCFGFLVFWAVVYDFLHNPGYPKEAAARLGIARVEGALAAYQATHGECPPSLRVLIVPENGKAAPLEDKELLDPWGGPFRYDPSNRHPQTGRPRIFTVSPQGDKISNW
jgi:hypothetical protein